jgi:bidirectional [NiFe] hydrogenase diaphorase subunit
MVTSLPPATASLPVTNGAPDLAHGATVVVNGPEQRIVVCTSAGCLSSNGKAVKDALDALTKDQRYAGKFRVQGTGCLGLCARGPLALTKPDGRIYADIQPEQAEQIVQRLLGEDAAVAAEIAASAAASLGTGVDGVTPLVELPADLPFFSKQRKIVLSGAGSVDPEKIDDYVAANGYEALNKALHEMTPAQVIDELTRSGLRGRGGAGYPSGVKWSLVAKATSGQKYVICNGDEGDPGAFMDRSVMEGDPHRVLEGMAIAGYAVGANQGYIYVRGEYPLAIQRLQNAIRQAERRGYLGARVFDTPFQFRIDLRIGAGAFVCGEETALISSIEGGRGLPRARPPYPSTSGLWGKPTLINNVESYANVAPIIRNGAAWYASFGTEKSNGTKVFALAGKITNTGLIEVPFGIKLRELIFEIGGDIPGGGTFKAVQTGGPSGGCIPAAFLDMPLDYENLAKVGAIVGSGGMIVMDDTSCMVDVARYFTEFCMSESCGKCIPCRAGLVQAHRILNRMTSGTGTMQDLAMLEELCVYIRDASLCGLGQNAPNPILSTLRYFRDEYLTHIQDKRCPAGVCTMPARPGKAEVSPRSSAPAAVQLQEATA